MSVEHPIDGLLRTIDPRCHRVSVMDLMTCGDSGLKATMFIMNKPIVGLDVTLLPQTGGGVRLTSPRPLPVMLVGTGIHSDGVTELGALSVTTCRHRHNVSGVPLWNPLCVTLAWFDGLQYVAGDVGMVMPFAIARHLNEYCPDGLNTLAAILAAADSRA